MDEAAYKEQAKDRNKPSEKKKSIVTLTGANGERVLKNNSCGSYFKIFLVLWPIIFQKSLIFRYCNQYSRLVPDQHIHFFYVCSHLRAPQNGHAIISTKFKGFIFE